MGVPPAVAELIADRAFQADLIALSSAVAGLAGEGRTTGTPVRVQPRTPATPVHAPRDLRALNAAVNPGSSGVPEVSRCLRRRGALPPPEPEIRR